MYSFAVAFGNGASVTRLRTALQRVEAAVPSLGSAGAYEEVELADVDVRWVSVRPEADYATSLIQSVVEPSAAVLSWGSLSGSDRVAATVLDVFRSEGPQGVCELDGSFSAVIVDRLQGRVLLVSDLVGHRSLYFARQGFEPNDALVAEVNAALPEGAGSWVCSPHDLVLLAIRGQAPELDLVSAASIALCDWSLGGRSLARQIHSCDSRSLVEWQAGTLKRRAVRPLVGDKRLDARDQAGVGDCVELVAAEYERRSREFLYGKDQVSTALTAGMDSRAVWALLVGARTTQELLPYTTGGVGSQDVRVARQLAALSGAKHRVNVPAQAITTDFDTTARLLAFYTNGTANAKRALTAPPAVDSSKPFIAGGVGGEIVRGFFYPYFGARGRFPDAVEDLVAALVRWRFRRIGKVPVADLAVTAAVVERLHHTLEAYGTESRSGADRLDLLYLFERYGRWGARNGVPWSRQWSPFDSTPAMRAAFRLPAPIGKHCPVHALLVQRHLPVVAYWIPINGGQLLALEGNGRVRYALRSLMNAGAKGAGVLRREQARLGSRLGLRQDRAGEDVEAIRARHFAEILSEQVAALIMRPDGVATQLLGPVGVKRVISQHAAGRDQLQLLGFLVTLEHWLDLAKAVTQPPIP